jgi:VanZ family protein
MKKTYLLALRFVPILFWLLLITITLFMLVELPTKLGGWPYWDKVQHASVFMVLTLIATLVFRQKNILVAIGLISYGAATELLQSWFTVTRLASINDWLADIAGVMIGLLIFALVKKLSQHIKSYDTRI